MLDTYLQMAVEKQKIASAKLAMLEVLKQFPVEELQKIASMGLSMGSCEGPWVKQFQGTPLFEQAMALEQEGIQLDLEDNNRRQMDQEHWAQKDTINLKRRLLELELVRSSEAESQQAAAMEASMAQAAPVEAPVEEKPKAAPAEPKTAGINPGMLAGIGTKALNFAKANPGVVAGAVGGGLLGASQGEGVGGKIMGGLGGAAAGAGLGGAAQVGVGAAKMMQSQGRPLASALRRSYNGQVAQGAQSLGFHPSQAKGLMVGVK